MNGAHCELYSWSQNHIEIEIRVKLEKPIKKSDIKVDVDKQSRELRVNNSVFGILHDNIDYDSIFWTFDTQNNNFLIYFDKRSSSWWPVLCQNETQLRKGTKHYSIPASELDEPSRAVANKLLRDQINKLTIREQKSAQSTMQQ